MLNQHIPLRPTHVRRARTAVRERLVELGCEPEHLVAIETVIAEFLAAVIESGCSGSVELSIERFPLLTSVRLRCPPGMEQRDDPLRLRERVLERLTVAVGERRNADGIAELWAEVPRPSWAASARV
jgi:hypothetical protein